MEDTVKLIIEGKEYEFPVVVGSEGEKAIDISKLRAETGYISFDPGFANTGSCCSNISFVEGEAGKLNYRGIPIEELAQNSTFVETMHLLIWGELPTRQQLTRFSTLLNEHSMVHEDMQIFFQHFPMNSPPMNILSSMINALRFFYTSVGSSSQPELEIVYIRLLSKIRTLAAMSYKISTGHRPVYPRPDLSYCANFLNMMFDNPVKPYIIDDDIVKALNVFWIVRAEHEQNNSTTAVRLVSSGKVNIYAAISAGASALGGPLHGGAILSVMQMLERIYEQGGDIKPFIERAKCHNFPTRLMGFGHRINKIYDLRAKIVKEEYLKLKKKLGLEDPLWEIVENLTDEVKKDEYFIQHKLFPNVDLYSGLLLRAIGIPLSMFTVMYAIGRLPGWIAHWKEQHEDEKARLHRPRQIYVGPSLTDYTPMEDRKEIY